MARKQTDRRAAVPGVALLVTTALSGAALPSPALAWTEDQEWNAYANSGYSYCDAKLVTAAWGEDVYQGKLWIGAKILNGIPNAIPEALSNSRAVGNSCEWIDLPYSYEDAEQIASVWGLNDAGQAKDKMAWLATNGRSFQIDQALGR